MRNCESPDRFSGTRCARICMMAMCRAAAARAACSASVFNACRVVFNLRESKFLFAAPAASLELAEGENVFLTSLPNE
jgi:hypothetical protein